MTRKRNAMTREYDSPWKEALERFFKQFLALLFPAVHREIDWSRGYEMLHAELEQIVREAELGTVLADVLVKVYRHDGEEIWVLIHVEVQAQPDARLPERMFIYHYRIFDRYHRPVVSLAVLADEQAAWRPDHYEHDLWGCRVQLDYPIVKLLDFQNQLDLLESDENPFCAVGGCPPSKSGHSPRPHATHGLEDPTVSCTVATKPDGARSSGTVANRGLVSGIATPRRATISSGLADLEKGATYAIHTSFERFAREEGRIEGERKGERKGKRKGKREGERMGERKGLLEGLESCLDLKFGAKGVALMPEIRTITDPKQLRDLLAMIRSVKTLNDFRALLPEATE